MDLRRRRPERSTTRIPLVVVALFALSCSVPASALELGPWQVPESRDRPSFHGHIYDIAEYRGQIVLAGDFEIWKSADHIATDLAIFDGQTFRGVLGDYDPEGWIRSVYVKDGNLFFGGRFRRVDGMPVDNIAVWYQGREFLAVGDGDPGLVQRMGEFDGKLVVASAFASTSTVPVLLHTLNQGHFEGIPLPEGVQFGAARALLDRGTELWVGGSFVAPGEDPTGGRSVMIWDGSTWSQPGDGLRSAGDSNSGTFLDGIFGATDLVEWDGRVYAGGSFQDPGRGLGGFACWDGETWQELPMRGQVHGLVRMSDGVLPLGRMETMLEGGIYGSAPSVWTGAQWGVLEEDPTLGLGQVSRRGLVHDGSLYVAGESVLPQSSYTVNRSLLSWDGSQWSQEFGVFETTWYTTAIIEQEGIILLAGLMYAAGGTGSNYVVGWNGNEYVPFSMGMTRSSCECTDSGINGFGRYQGQLITHGWFGIDGHPDKNIAAWTGQRWQALGNGISLTPGADGRASEYIGATAEYEGRLVVAGRFGEVDGIVVNGLASWNGSSWEAYPPGPIERWTEAGEIERGTVSSLAVFDGILLASGDFHRIDGVVAPFIAAWNGSEWAPFATGIFEPLQFFGSEGTALYAAGRYDYRSDHRDWYRVQSGGLSPLPDAVNQLVAFGMTEVGDAVLFTSPSGIWSWRQGQLEQVSTQSYGNMLRSGRRLYVGSFPVYGERYRTSIAWAPLDGTVPTVTLDLQATLREGTITLAWSSSAAELVDAFQLQRRCEDCVWETVESFDANTTTYVDTTPRQGLWTYRLTAIVNGTRIESTPVTLDTRVGGTPTRSFVNSVRPNPFNGATTIEYTLGQAGNVTVKVYSLDGRQVRNAPQGARPIGPHQFTWDGRDDQSNSVASGVYVLRVEAPDRVMTQRVAYVK